MRILSWNMAAGWGFKTSRHEAAWRWLSDLDPDVALLQEAIPPGWINERWQSVTAARYRKRQPWGSAIVSTDAEVVSYAPTQKTPWLAELWGGTVVASRAGLWLASIHSSASQVKPERLGLFPTELVRRCHPGGIWEIELVAHDLEKLVDGSRIIAGGDLNSGMLFDQRNGYDYNARLWQNLSDSGLKDLRTPFFPEEQQTFFRKGSAAFQLDHVFADRQTAKTARSWRVIPEPAVELGLSDHAAIEIVFE